MNLNTLGVLSSIALVASLSSPAFAQDAEGGQDDVDEPSRNTTIVVTAEFREADLQDTPIAITR